MINEPAIRFIEAATGKKMPSLMAGRANISERTLRNFPFSNKTIEKISVGSEHHLEKKLEYLGYTVEEIFQITSNHPKSPYAGIIYEEQEASVFEYPYTIELAKKIDDISISLSNAWMESDVEEMKNVLMSSEFSTRQYFADTEDNWANEQLPDRLNFIKSAQTLEDIGRLINILTMNCLFSLMACWDIEFYSQYSPKLIPRTWFSLVLPKVDPVVEHHNSKEMKKRRGMFWLPSKRLIDVISCFGLYSKRGGFPDEIPKLSDGSNWRNETEQNLVNWRDGTKRLFYNDFFRLWEVNCKDLVAPSPLYVAAKMWEIYLVEIDDKSKTIVLANNWYQLWWEKHYTDLTSDLDLSSDGKDHWPKCFDII